MLFSILALLSGFALLVFAGDYLVRGAVGLAENFRIPQLVIGLTIVAFGTSAPELFISAQAALTGAPGIAVGNVVGSNIANVLLVLGLPAMILPTLTDQYGVRRSVIAMIAVTVLFMWMAGDGVISRIDGIILLAALGAFIYWQIGMASGGRPPDFHDEIGTAPHDNGRIALFVVGGIIGLPLGAQLTIIGATDIARSFGISETAVGLTIVALGTSLPELATGIMAAYRGSSAVAIGNVVGSNIFNIACIMGITSVLIPVAVDPHIISTDMWVMIAAALLVAIITVGRIRIGRLLGAAMTLAFIGYIMSVF
ncbi:MAG: calcium/sodium antiporter [Brucellaceae bacterium]|nr:calcium/sodium antiporter [Brucellaceae bacterium]